MGRIGIATAGKVKNGVEGWAYVRGIYIYVLGYLETLPPNGLMFIELRTCTNLVSAQRLWTHNRETKRCFK